MADYKQTSVEITFNILPDLSDRAHRLLSQMVRKAAHDIEAQAKILAPVDTGTLRASIHTVTSTNSGYDASFARAAKKNGQAVLLDEVPAPDSDLEAIVAVGAAHGVFVEFGTVKMAARPFLTPAAEAVEQPFLDAVGATIEAAARGLL